MFAIIVPIITTPYLARVLGAEGIGKYAYSYSIAYYFSLFIKMGLNNYGNRTIAIARTDEDELSHKFWNIYAMQLIICIFVVVAYLVYALFWRKSEIVPLLFVLFIFSVGIDITWFFYGLEEFKATTIRDMFIKVATTICIFAFIREEGDVWKYTLIMSMGCLLSQLLLWPLLLKKIKWVSPTWCLIKVHIRPNIILFIPTIAVSLYKTMDKIMLGGIAGELEVGYYESCEKVIQVPLALIVALGTVMLPHMSNLCSKEDYNRDKVIAIIRKSEYLMILVSSLIGFGIMAVAREFVPLFYGSGYEKCINIFYVLLPSCIFLAFANVIRTQYLLPNKMDKEFIISLFGGAITNLVLNMLLIPRFQSLGAAVGTLVAEFVVCILQVIFVYNKIPIIAIGKECIGYTLVSLSMFLFGVLIPLEMTSLLEQLIFKIILCGCYGGIAMGIYCIALLKRVKKCY